MLFSHIGILDEHFDYRPDMFVGTQDGRIAYVSAAEPSPAQAAALGERYDGRGKLLMPAFYNAHAHAPMVLLRGYAENLRLQEWLNDAVFPFEGRMTDDDAHAAMLVALAEMARFGCVSCSDMYFCDDARCEAVRDFGAKCNVSRGVTAFDEDDFAKTNDAKAYETLWDWDGAADGRIKVDLCLHAEYTNNEHTYRQVAELARQHGAIVHVHVSETRSEHEECQARHRGLTPTGLLLETGVLDSPVLAAHCVWCTPQDLDVLAEHNASIVCNPASNMKLASGFAPVGGMLQRGINVALGTDGVASNNAHDMLRDTYLFATIYKGASGDPTLVTPRQALYAATRAGALAQGRADCGLVREGMRADLTVMDVATPWMCPVSDMAANVVYSASGSDVVLTMCDGVVLYRDGAWPTADVATAMERTQAATDRIRAELGK